MLLPPVCRVNGLIFGKASDSSIGEGGGGVVVIANVLLSSRCDCTYATLSFFRLPPFTLCLLSGFRNLSLDHTRVVSPQVLPLAWSLAHIVSYTGSVDAACSRSLFWSCAQASGCIGPPMQCYACATCF